MQLHTLTALSLAFQRSFPGIFHHVSRLQNARRKSESRQLHWPAWCCFPVGLAYEVLRHHYGYDRDGVEPFLLAALAGWRSSREVLLLDAPGFEAATIMPEVDETPLAGLWSRAEFSLYVQYPSGAQALGSFIFLDYNGEEQQHLVFLLHLAMYRVEPLLLPLTLRHHSLGDCAADLQQCCAAHYEREDQARLFRQAMALCGVNLGVLRGVCRSEVSQQEPSQLN